MGHIRPVLYLNIIENQNSGGEEPKTGTILISMDGTKLYLFFDVLCFRKLPWICLCKFTGKTLE